MLAVIPTDLPTGSIRCDLKCAIRRRIGDRAQERLLVSGINEIAIIQDCTRNPNSLNVHPGKKRVVGKYPAEHLLCLRWLKRLDVRIVERHIDQSLPSAFGANPLGFIEQLR